MSQDENDLIRHLRHEAFLHGFVAARDPKNPGQTLRVLEEAERAWSVHFAVRREAAER